MQNIEKTYFSRYCFFASFDFYNSQDIIFPKLWLNIWLYYSCCMATSLFPQMSSPVWLTEYPLHWVIYPCAVRLVNLSLSHVHRQDTMPPIVQPLQSHLNVGHEHSTAKTSSSCWCSFYWSHASWWADYMHQLGFVFSIVLKGWKQ